jgi:hypothetical protein
MIFTQRSAKLVGQSPAKVGSTGRYETYQKMIHDTHDMQAKSVVQPAKGKKPMRSFILTTLFVLLALALIVGYAEQVMAVVIGGF